MPDVRDDIENGLTEVSDHIENASFGRKLAYVGAAVAGFVALLVGVNSCEMISAYQSRANREQASNFKEADEIRKCRERSIKNIFGDYSGQQDGNEDCRVTNALGQCCDYVDKNWQCIIGHKAASSARTKDISKIVSEAVSKSAKQPGSTVNVTVEQNYHNNSPYSQEFTLALMREIDYRCSFVYGKSRQLEIPNPFVASLKKPAAKEKSEEQPKLEVKQEAKDAKADAAKPQEKPAAADVKTEAPQPAPEEVKQEEPPAAQPEPKAEKQQPAKAAPKNNAKGGRRR